MISTRLTIHHIIALLAFVARTVARDDLSNARERMRIALFDARHLVVDGAQVLLRRPDLFDAGFCKQKSFLAATG